MDNSCLFKVPFFWQTFCPVLSMRRSIHCARRQSGIGDNCYLTQWHSTGSPPMHLHQLPFIRKQGRVLVTSESSHIVAKICRWQGQVASSTCMRCFKRNSQKNLQLYCCESVCCIFVTFSVFQHLCCCWTQRREKWKQRVFLLHFWWNTDHILQTGGDSDVGLILLGFPQEVWEGRIRWRRVFVQFKGVGVIFSNLRRKNFFCNQSSQKYLLQKHTILILKQNIGHPKSVELLVISNN